MENAVPREFAYWQNLDRPWARALRRGVKALFGFDPAPDDEVVKTLGSMYYDADPLAEAFVDEVYLKQGSAVGRAMLEKALSSGVESVEGAPASLHALFADIERDPSWVSPERVEQGARVFRRFGQDVFRFAGAITLSAYVESSVAKPLVLTGAYAGKSTKHRFLETAAFWIAVSEPGGLAPGAAGRASALRVRMMHVFVRRRLLSHPEWRLDDWGVPISQGDALLTLMGGSFAPGLALRAMGYRTTDDEIDALMHFWRYVGHLMGVRPRWYPSNAREAWQLSFVTLLKGSHQAGDDGKHLCQSYNEAFAPDPAAAPLARLRAKLSDGVHRGYTRFFMPTWAYREQGLPGAGLWALSPLVQFPLLFSAETLRLRFPALDPIADGQARRRRRAWFERHMGGRRAEYNPAETFTR